MLGRSSISKRFVYATVLILFLIQGATGQILYEYDNSVPVIENDRALNDPWAGGLNSGQYGRIDFNGDGQKDLIVYDRAANRLNTYLNQDDQFIFTPEYRSSFPEDIEGWILIRDYDCDGRPDLFANAARGMKVYRNTGFSAGLISWELIADPVLTLTPSGIINLQVNVTDIPGIRDLDGDGDLDILVYNFALGGYIRHHKNMSKEKTGACGIEYELVTRSWGLFEECLCFLYAFLEEGETCDDLIGQRVMHPGGKSLLLIDMDNDGDKDFFGGHEQCDEFYFLENVGTPEEAVMTDFRVDFPDEDKPAVFPTFPAGYYDDFDLDGIPDMVVAPNVYESPEYRIDFSRSSWLYTNRGTAENPEFDFRTEQFLQADMIDAGENAVPVLFDGDGDGDLDLYIAANGKKMDGTFYGYIRLYENTGNVLEPEFRLADDDLFGLSNWKIFDPVIQLADLDHDQSADLVLFYTNSTDLSRQADVFFNSKGPGEGLDIDLSGGVALNVETRANDTPFFTDVNRDGRTDMLLGKSSGRLELHLNTGSRENPFFELEDLAYLGIDDDFITFKRNLVPFVMDLDLDGRDDLVTTDYSGVAAIYMHYREDPEIIYEIIHNPVTETDDSTQWGFHNWLTGGLLFADEYPALITGNIQGGLSLYRSAFDRQASDSPVIEMTLYPNPLSGRKILTVKTNREGRIDLVNSLGQVLMESIPIQAYIPARFEIPELTAGIYLVRFTGKDGSISEKLVRY